MKGWPALLLLEKGFAILQQTRHPKIRQLKVVDLVGVQNLAGHRGFAGLSRFDERDECGCGLDRGWWGIGSFR